MSCRLAQRLPGVGWSERDAPADPAAIVVRVRGPLAPEQAQELCDRVWALLLADGTRTVVCDVPGEVDLSVVDVLARLQLTARRLDAFLRVRTSGDGLEALLALTGLGDAVPDRLEARGQAEAAEQRGVEEVVDVHNLPG